MRVLSLVATVLSLGLIASACSGGEERVQQNDLMETEQVEAGEGLVEEVIYYTCPMEEHSHIHSSEAGECPECGMALVAAVETTEENAEFYGCPMEEHSHVRSSEPGRCPECGMFLKPMRLKKD